MSFSPTAHTAPRSNPTGRNEPCFKVYSEPSVNRYAHLDIETPSAGADTSPAGEVTSTPEPSRRSASSTIHQITHSPTQQSSRVGAARVLCPRYTGCCAGSARGWSGRAPPATTVCLADGSAPFSNFFVSLLLLWRAGGASTSGTWAARGTCAATLAQRSRFARPCPCSCSSFTDGPPAFSRYKPLHPPPCILRSRGGRRGWYRIAPTLYRLC